MTVIPPYTGIQHDHTDETNPSHGTLHRGQEAAIEAALTADAVLIAAFPGTLSPAITPLAWTGYPPAKAPCPSRAEEYQVRNPDTGDVFDRARCTHCRHSWDLDPGADALCRACGGSGDPGARHRTALFAPRCGCVGTAGSERPQPKPQQ